LNRAKSIFAVRWADDNITDYLLTSRASDVLSLGPHLLDLIKMHPGTLLPREDEPDLPCEGGFVNVAARTLFMWDFSELEPRYLKALRYCWPEWQVYGHADGLALHVAITGRDPTPIMVPEMQAIDELIDELTQESSTDPNVSNG
jgi:hypothetical protein